MTTPQQHPERPTIARATFDTISRALTIDGQRWPLTDEQAALGPTYDLAAQLYDITGRWHLVPTPKTPPGTPRLPGRNAVVDVEAGVLVVDVEEVHPPETEQSVPYLAGYDATLGQHVYVHPGESVPRPLDAYRA
jgi:hypothetical protein